MTKYQQLEWINLEDWIQEMERDSGRNADHIRSTVDRLKTKNLSFVVIADICVALRSTYGLGAGKAF